MTLMDTMNFNIPEAVEQLKQGNTDVLRGLPPAAVISLAVATQQEIGEYKEPSPISEDEVAKSMLERMADSGIKERLLKEIEERQEQAAQAKQNADSMNNN